ncbi:MAG: RNA-binding protein [Spirochaetales bacterium]|nr:RNA-binding protein [Spirochaetales bacterium]
MQDSKLYVGNLNYSTSNEKLQNVFGAHGTVLKVNIMEGKGFGFVEMSTVEEADAAKQALNGTELDGRNIKVDKARPPADRPRRSYNDNRY